MEVSCGLYIKTNFYKQIIQILEWAILESGLVNVLEHKNRKLIWKYVDFQQINAKWIIILNWQFPKQFCSWKMCQINCIHVNIYFVIQINFGTYFVHLRSSHFQL